jgi:hypothetical protein
VAYVYAFDEAKGSGQLRVFHNAVEVASKAEVLPLKVSGPLVVGAGARSDTALFGLLSELRIWSVARTEQQIAATLKRSFAPASAVAAEAELFAGLNASWSFSEGSLLEGVRGRTVGVAAQTSVFSSFASKWIPIESLSDRGLRLRPITALGDADDSKAPVVERKAHSGDAEWALDLSNNSHALPLGTFGMPSPFFLLRLT